MKHKFNITALKQYLELKKKHSKTTDIAKKNHM